ncbi:FAD:protein FMN transferase [bacterium D16-51]|nr:FAD:protein FMN transferase [bacterium D16-59]RKI61695.1 FAD:protein FMN transferase [bacterium D16-51]
MGTIRKKGKIFFIMAALACVLFSGCAALQEKENLSISGFAFDTTYTITLYEGGSREVLDACVSKCSEYEKVFSRTLKDSELYQINEIEEIYKKAVEENSKLKSQWKQKNVRYDEEGLARLKAAIEAGRTEGNAAEYKLHKDGSITFPVSEMMEEILSKGLEYSEKSQGGFDLSIEPVTSLWDFKAEKPEVPVKEEIRKALEYVDYRKVLLQDGKLSFSMPGMGIDLGGIAKGFIADDLKKYLLGQGVKGALINLGGNVLCIGGKEDGEPFYVGVQQPFAQRSQTIAAVAVKDVSVVSSGIYERYFKTEDGAMYHHIINPETGYPYENDLLGVTILSEKSVDGDGLSTTCFALGREKGIEYVNSLEDVYAVFITEDEKLWYSDGFEKFLKEGESG